MIEEERLNNPFYMTLKAQKEERDKFIDFYQSGMLLGLPVASSNTTDGRVEYVSQSLEIEGDYG